jgi:flagellar motor switch protein FliN
MISNESAASQGSKNQILQAWTAQLATSIQRLTGVEPTMHWASRADEIDASAILWWEFATGSPRARIHVGAAESSWRGLAARVLSSSPSIGAYIDAKQVYVNLLEQSSEQKGVLSGHLPSCDHFEAVELRFPDQQPVRLLLGMEDDGSPEAESALGVLSGIELPITIRFGSTQMFLQDLASLDAGSAIEFDRGMDEAVEILVNGRLVARGDAVVVHGNYGIRITEVTSRHQRLNSSYKVVPGINAEIES